jgi:hypothetical protein
MKELSVKLNICDRENTVIQNVLHYADASTQQATIVNMLETWLKSTHWA